MNIRGTKNGKRLTVKRQAFVHVSLDLQRVGIVKTDEVSASQTNLIYEVGEVYCISHVHHNENQLTTRKRVHNYGGVLELQKSIRVSLTI